MTINKMIYIPFYTENFYRHSVACRRDITFAKLQTQSPSAGSGKFSEDTEIS